MHTVVFTKSLDNAESMETKFWQYDDFKDAKALFEEKVNELIKTVYDNEFLHANINLFAHNALIKIENTHYCIAIVGE